MVQLTITYKTNNQSEGKGIGTDKGLTVSGSGELDNGWTFSTYSYLSDAMGLSSARNFTDYGFNRNNHSWYKAGVVIVHGFDEEVPQAYEQVSDLSCWSGSSNSVGAFMDNGGLTWAVPSFDLGGASASLVLGWSPNADDAAVNNGGVGTRSGSWGDGT